MIQVNENKSGTFLKVEYDKWLHFMAGYIIMITTSLFFGPLIGFVVVVFIAYLKEVHDHFKPGSSYDRKDINWTIYGLFPAQILLDIYEFKGAIYAYDLNWLIAYFQAI